MGQGFKKGGKFIPINDSDKKSLELVGENYADLTILLKDDREHPQLDKLTKEQLAQDSVTISRLVQQLPQGSQKIVLEKFAKIQEEDKEARK